MLPPFRIRKLGPSAPTASRVSHGSRLVPNEDPLLRITAPQYDSTISDHPDAKLRYVDDDDGEIVTVGTSLELFQRLQEPLSERLYPQQDHHVFDVDRKEASIKVWRSLAEQETKWGSVGRLIAAECGHSILGQDSSRPLGPDAPRICTPTAVAQDQEVDHTSIESEVEDYRKKYIEACNPPQVIPPQDITPALFRRFDTAKHTSRAISNCATNPRTLSLIAGPASLTPEGQRQAQAAGDRMRASRYSRRTVAAPEPLPLNYQNRWASYNRPTSCFGVDNRLNFFDPLAGGSSGRRQAQAAGDTMRSQRSRIRQPKSKSDVCSPAIIDTRNLAGTGRRSEHFDVPNAHATSTSGSLATEPPVKSVQSQNLLEVFESEFCKDKIQGELGGVAPDQIFSSPNVDISTFPIRTQNHTPSRPFEGRNSADLKITNPSASTPSGQEISPSIKQSVDDITSVISHLQTQAHSSQVDIPAQEMALGLEKALTCALCELKLCLSKIAESAQDVTKLAYSKSQHRSNQQTEDALQPRHSFSHKVTASPRIRSCPQCSSANRTVRKSCKMSEASMQGSPIEKAINAASNLDLSISRSCEPSRNQNFPPKADSSKSELEFSDFGSISEATARAGLHEQKQTQDLPVSLPLDHELPITKEHTAISNDLNSGIPSSGSFTLDQESSAELTNEYQTKSLASGSGETDGGPSQVFPSLPGMKPLVPSQNVQPSSEDSVVRGDSYASLDVADSSPSRLPFPEAPVRKFPVAGSSDKNTESSRRPYSTDFDGSGRTPWSSSLQQRPVHVEGSSATDVHTIGSRPDSLQLGAQNAHISALFSQDIYAAEHTDVTTASKVQRCVEQLRKLGFGSDADGSMQRLVIYAQAADGDLVEAIDIIDEEQRAYRQRC